MKHTAAGSRCETFEARVLAKARKRSTTRKPKERGISTFINAAAALRLMTATESRLRRRGNQFRAERELEKEQSEAVPGVMGVGGSPRPSASSTMRKARPRDKGSTIYTQTHGHTHRVCRRCCTALIHISLSSHMSRDGIGSSRRADKTGKGFLEKMEESSNKLFNCSCLETII